LIYDLSLKLRPCGRRHPQTWLARILAEVERDLAEQNDPDLAPMDDMDIEFRRPQTAMVTAVGIYRKKLADRDYLQRVITGQQRQTPSQRRALGAVLDYAVQINQRSIEGSRHLEEKVERLNADSLSELANNPRQLMILQRHQTRLELSIERKYRLLRDSRTAGADLPMPASAEPKPLRRRPHPDGNAVSAGSDPEPGRLDAPIHAAPSAHAPP
jgi:hypothetical protein